MTLSFLALLALLENLPIKETALLAKRGLAADTWSCA